MKAKEYAEKFPAAEKDEHLVLITLALIEEMHKIIKSRNARTQRAIFSVFKEQNQKWYAIMRVMNIDECYRTLFRKGIEESLPSWKLLLSLNN